ncbi:glycosyltransferase family 2 protein [Clostridium perfringens]
MSKKNILCSIIIPVYNVEKYLERCINSIINQTEKNIEIILVDDGSLDKSGNICDSFAKNDSRIVVIHKKNGGLSDARNKGLEISNGKYILFVDSDDWCEENFVEEICNIAELNSLDLVVCGYKINYSNNNYIINKNFNFERKFCGKKEISEAIINLDTNGMFNVVWNKLYKREIIEKFKIEFDINAVPGEDLLFNCNYFTYIKNIYLLDKIYYNYMRQDEETLVCKYRKDLYEKVKIFNKKREGLYNFYNMNTDKYIGILAELNIEYLFCCIPNLYRKDCCLTKYERKKYIHTILCDSDIKNNIKLYKPKSFNLKLFKLLYIINSTTLTFSIYSVLFVFRYNFDKIYRKIRKKIIY